MYFKAMLVGAALGVTDPNNVTNLAQYGVLGLVVLGFVTRKIVSGELLERAEAKIAERDALIQRMQEKMEDKFVPALVRSTEAVAEMTELLAKRRPPPGRQP